MHRPEPSAASGRLLPGIEGLRGVAALSVMLAHIAIGMLGGWQAPAALGLLVGLGLHGLTLFFVLSGFLLYRPYAAALVGGRPRPSTGRFYRNRVLRIWPAYAVVLLVAGLVLGTAVVHAGTPPDGDVVAAHVGRLTDPGLLLLNLSLTQGFVPAGMFTGLDVSWSLVPEVCFYVLLPALALLGVVLARRVRPAVAAYLPAVLLLALGTLGRTLGSALTHAQGPDRVAYLQSGGTWQAVLFRGILTQADLFALGMLAAALVVSGWPRARGVARAATALGSVATVALLNTDFVHPAMALLLAGVVALLQLDGGGRLRRTALASLQARPLHRLGLISYSVYLWHFPLLWFVRLHVPGSRYDGPLGLIADLVGISALTLVAATLTYRYVELPALRRKRPAAVASVPAAASD